MTEQVQKITIDDVDRFWKAQLHAIDRWEWLMEHNIPRVDIEEAWENVECWTQMAKEINDEYNKQYDRRNCLHKNVVHYLEPDGDITVCSDCGAFLDEMGFVYHYSPPLEEIF